MRALTWLFRVALAVGAGALLVTSLVIAVAPRLWHVANSHEELPIDLPDFEPLSQRSLVYDRNGGLIDIYELENSQPVKLDEVPEPVISAFVAVEDKEFYQHNGVNLRSLIRATLSNFASDGPQQGASTITMQVVKNEYLAGLERDGRYKLLQIHYAKMLEKKSTKSEILERYLNTVFFGNNAYGIQAASETYFGKSVGELTFIEAAFLAGLVRAPTTYDPINSPERSRLRFVQVLDRLKADEYITKRQAKVLATDFVLPERPRSLPTEQTVRTYYSEALREYLLQRSDILGTTFEERYNTLYRGGLRIYTTLDPRLQLLAAAARNQVPANAAGIDAAIVSLDSQTGAIRAMVGGRGFEAGQNEVNMALAPRQTGSSAKIFILAAAVQAGAQPADIIDGFTPCSFPIPDQPGESFDIDATEAVGGGLDPLEQHTYDSINCAYVRLSQIVGLSRVVDTTYRMAESPYLFKGQANDDRRGLQPLLSFATGANELSTLDMAAGAQTLANEGVHHKPYYVDRVETIDGQTLYTHFDGGTPVLDRDAALTTIDMLKKVLGPDGTAYRYPLEGGRPAAGKTGTQQDNTNATFVGFTPQLATAVWMGDPDGYTSMTQATVPEFTEEVQGGRLPTLIWKTFMDPALAGKPVFDWPAPPPPTRYPARLFLPGQECVTRIVRYETQVIGYGIGGGDQRQAPHGFVTPGRAPEQPPPSTDPPGQTTALPRTTQPPTTTAPTTQPPTTAAPTTKPPTTAPTTVPPPTTPPTTPTTAPPTAPPAPTPTTGAPTTSAAASTTTFLSTQAPTAPTAPPTTRAPVPITQVVPIYDELTATTISPDVLDPLAPMPSVPLSQPVRKC